MLVIQLKKTDSDYNTKISETEKKITDQDYDKLLLHKNLIS